MPVTRRAFIARTMLAALAGAVSAAWGRPDAAVVPITDPPVRKKPGDWEEVRRQFALSPKYIHMSALFIASHPKPVRDAIENYRRQLDANPVIYLQQENRRLTDRALSAAAQYLGVENPDDIALTDSTTQGLGLVYNGLRLNPGDEVITSDQDYYATHEALRLASERKGIKVRQVSLYERIEKISEEQITARLVRAITPQTRALALTWVHSNTGLKLPLRQIAGVVKEINAKREQAEQILICVDAVHGFGVEDSDMADLGCDFFIAGCHKWLFGPRGTGLIWGSRRGWERVMPTVPSFLDNGTMEAWIRGKEVDGRTNGRRMSPGGFKAFEHQWALTEAFEFHRRIGKSHIAARTVELTRQLKEGLVKMPRVTLHTPIAEGLSSGIVCFSIREMSPFRAADRLRRRGLICTVTPYATRYVRLTPSIRNNPGEIERALREIRALK